jgi:hypothetical protein
LRVSFFEKKKSIFFSEKKYLLFFFRKKSIFLFYIIKHSIFFLRRTHVHFFGEQKKTPFFPFFFWEAEKRFNFSVGPEFIGAKEEEILQPESWNVQFFRSIDHTSATIEGIATNFCSPPLAMNPRSTSPPSSLLLPPPPPSSSSGVEKGIQEAYINAIRLAERFIYVENQYFMGSSNFWSSPQEGCENRIPIEITRKIEQKIKAGQQFTAFIGFFFYAGDRVFPENSDGVV